MDENRPGVLLKSIAGIVVVLFVVALAVFFGESSLMKYFQEQDNKPRVSKETADLIERARSSRPDVILYEAEVESDTKWSGYFGNRTVEGDGNMTVSLPASAPCANIQKQTERGTLKVRITREVNGIARPLDSDWVETTAQYGVASACWDRQ